MFAAFEEEAPRTEWALNMDVSTPAASKVDFSHRAMVLDATALCGLITITNNLVSSPLRISVRLS